MTTMTGKTQRDLNAAKLLVELNATIATNQAYLDSTDWHVVYCFETGAALDPTIKAARAKARAVITATRAKLPAGGTT